MINNPTYKKKYLFHTIIISFIIFYIDRIELLDKYRSILEVPGSVLFLNIQYFQFHAQ